MIRPKPMVDAQVVRAEGSMRRMKNGRKSQNVSGAEVRKTRPWRYTPRNAR